MIAAAIYLMASVADLQAEFPDAFSTLYAETEKFCQWPSPFEAEQLKCIAERKAQVDAEFEKFDPDWEDGALGDRKLAVDFCMRKVREMELGIDLFSSCMLSLSGAERSIALIAIGVPTYAINKEGFHALLHGMTLPEVEATLGSAGKLKVESSGAGGYIEIYDWGGHPGSVISVTFTDQQLATKTFYP